MKAVSLLYHDAVTDADRMDESGFPGAGAAPYKLDIVEMKEHFCGLAGPPSLNPSRVTDYLDARHEQEGCPLFITFDDGGKSAATVIAGMLEERQWSCHFFITTDFIGTPEFVNAEELRSLHRAGHVIGSHSASHPTRMAACDRAELFKEWSESKARLEDILSAPVTVASVPGGFFSRTVAETASEAGFRALFTSEPIKRVARVGDCLVLGRYNLWRGMAPSVSRRLAQSRLTYPQIRQYMLWNAKKVIKNLGGTRYLTWRRMLLDKSLRSP